MRCHDTRTRAGCRFGRAAPIGCEGRTGRGGCPVDANCGYGQHPKTPVDANCWYGQHPRANWVNLRRWKGALDAGRGPHAGYGPSRWKGPRRWKGTKRRERVQGPDTSDHRGPTLEAQRRSRGIPREDRNRLAGDTLHRVLRRGECGRNRRGSHDRPRHGRRCPRSRRRPRRPLPRGADRQPHPAGRVTVTATPGVRQSDGCPASSQHRRSSAHSRAGMGRGARVVLGRHGGVRGRRCACPLPFDR
jgi:hypothetical protein